MAPIPYGYGLADIMALLHGRKPTITEADEAAEGAIRQFRKGAKAFGLLDASELDGLLDEAMKAAGCSVSELAANAHVSEKSVYGWKKDISGIGTEYFISLCRGLVESAVYPVGAWRTLFIVTRSVMESDKRIVARIEGYKRQRVIDAVCKLSGVALDSVYTHAVALADAVPSGWIDEVERGTEFTATQKAVLLADASAMIDANNDIRKAADEAL